MNTSESKWQQMKGTERKWKIDKKSPQKVVKLLLNFILLLVTLGRELAVLTTPNASSALLHFNLLDAQAGRQVNPVRDE